MGAVGFPGNRPSHAKAKGNLLLRGAERQSNLNTEIAAALRASQ